MIYPTEVAKHDEACRLTTLDRLWVQGRLKMWGRWSYIGYYGAGNMFNRLLATRKITKTAITEIKRRLKQSGTSEADLALFFTQLLNGRMKSHLAFCTDSEALAIDHILGEVLSTEQIHLLHQRYDGHGKSKRRLADELNQRHPELSQMTCRRRIDTWLEVAEFSVYLPLSDFLINNRTALAK